MNKDIEIKDLSNNKNKKKRKPIHSDLPQIPLSLAVVGPSRCGKSNLVRNILMNPNYYKNMFDYIFIFCQSIEFNGDYDDIKSKSYEELENYNPNSKKKHKLVVNKYDHFDQEIIAQILEEQANIIRQYGQKRSPEILMLYDDVIDDPSFLNSNLLKSISTRGRHMNISVIISSQKLSLINTTIRANLTSIILFCPATMSEVDFFIEANVSKSQRKQFMECCKKVWETPYQFIMIDYLNRNLERRFRHGFSKPLGVHPI